MVYTRYIFLDTNNWIYLSNGFNILNNEHDEFHFKVFDFIVKNVENGRLTFLSNSIIFEEWERNKSNSKKQIIALQNKLKSYKSTLNSVKDFLVEGDIQITDELIAKMSEAIETKIKKHEKHILNVEHFLKYNTKNVEVSNEVKIHASDMAAARKAPFVGEKKNSMADALILLSSIEFVEKNLKTGGLFPENYFVSSNSGDFSDPNDRKQIHPDLAPYLRKTDTDFYYSLLELINNIDSEFLSEDDAALFEAHSSNCPLCNFEYAYTVLYSEPYKVYDPNKEADFNNPNQLTFGFEEIVNETIDRGDLESEIVEAHCSHCSADFFVCCECGELNEIQTHNETFPCEGDCGYFYILHSDIDRKGMIHGWEIEIVAGKVCQKCNEKFTELSDSGLCEECEESYNSDH